MNFNHNNNTIQSSYEFYKSNFKPGCGLTFKTSSKHNWIVNKKNVKVDLIKKMCNNYIKSYSKYDTYTELNNLKGCKEMDINKSNIGKSFSDRVASEVINEYQNNCYKLIKSIP